MPDHPIAVMMTAGILVFFVGAGGSYLWATFDTDPPEEQTASESAEPVDEPVDEQPEVDGAELGFHDWEDFPHYDGERVQMLGVNEGETVTLRRGPSAEADGVRQVSGRALLVRQDHWNDWFLARAEDGSIGWLPQGQVRLLNIPETIHQRFTEQLPPTSTSYSEQLPDRFDGYNLVRVATNYANFRRGPGTQFEMIRRIQQEERLLLLARQNNWYRAETASGRTGWVHGNLVDPIWALSPDSRTTLQTAGDAELRPGPSMSYRGSSLQGVGEQVTVLLNRGDWYQVELDDERIGWLHGAGLSD